MRHGHPIHRLEPPHELQHGNRNPRPHVEHLVLLAHTPPDHPIHSRHMGPGQVHHVDIVPQRRAVGGVVVIPENAQLPAHPSRGLGDKGHQIVGHPARQLADQRAGVCPDGIEIPQRNSPQPHLRMVRPHAILDHILAHLFGIPIGRPRPLTLGLLGSGQYFGLPIHGRRRRKNQIPNPPLPHQPQNGQQGAEIVPKVLQRLAHGLANGLESRKMDNGIGPVPLKHLPPELIHIPAIDPHERNSLSHDLFHPPHGPDLGIGQIVGNNHIIPRLYKLHSGMGADIPRPAGDQHGPFSYSLFHPLSHPLSYSLFHPLCCPPHNHLSPKNVCRSGRLSAIGRPYLPIARFSPTLIATPTSTSVSTIQFTPHPNPCESPTFSAIYPI